MTKRNASSSAAQQSLARHAGELFRVTPDSLTDATGHTATHVLVLDAKGEPVPGAQVVAWHGAVDGSPRGVQS